MNICLTQIHHLGLARVTVDSLKEMHGSILNKFLLVLRTIVQLSLRCFCISYCWIKRHKLCPEKTKDTITHECFFYLGSALHVRQKSTPSSVSSTTGRDWLKRNLLGKGIPSRSQSVEPKKSRCFPTSCPSSLILRSGEVP